jgi:hypothetical protein
MGRAMSATPAFFRYGKCHPVNQPNNRAPDYWTKRMYSGDRAHEAEAAELCRSCPVREACLLHGIVDPAGAFGMWGGFPEETVQEARRGRIHPAIELVLGPRLRKLRALGGLAREATVGVR